MNGKQLKNSILQWAIQGRLVPQDPNDEPAAVLLEKIRAEKTRLVKEGKLKKKDLEVKSIAEDEVPFEIPESWEWVRFFSIFQLETNLVSPQSYLDYPHVAPDNIEKGSGKLLNYRTVRADKVKSNNHLFKKGQIIYSKIRPLLKKAIIAPFDGLCSADMYPLSTLINYRFALCYLLSDAFNKQVSDICSTRVKMPKINQDELSTILVPLPPLAEQHRIVAKIEELMPLVEKYGEAQEALDEWNKALPEKLKKSILQEAIQGRLVPQDPTDEPASALLERIREEKKRLVKEGKLKKKDLEVKPIEEDEIPFEIPESWEWCRIGEITQSYIGLTYKPSEVTESGTIVLRSSNIKNGKLVLDDLVRVSMPISNKLWVEQNDIIICARNGSKKLVGKSAIVDEIKEPMTFGAFMAICKTSFYEYVYMFLQSELFYSQLRNVSGTTTINQLTQNSFNGFLIPLPPLAEQHRIVAKIEELFRVIKQ